MKNSHFGTKFPETQFPGEKNVLHKVIIETVDEEEVPSHEPLLEDGHLAKTTTCTSTAEENGAGRLCLDEDGRAHGDARAEHAGDVTEEPILTDRKTGVVEESLLEKFDVPKTDGSVRARYGQQRIFQNDTV